MRARNLLFFVLLITSVFAFNSCDKCNQDCFTPPRWYLFDIVDNETEENVFMTGAYNSDDVSVIDEEGNWVRHEFIAYGDTNIISLAEIGWNTGRHIYTISLDAETYINLVLEMQQVNENCCTFYRVIDFGVEDYEWYEVENSELIRIEL
jgi:hypothetical protein